MIINIYQNRSIIQTRTKYAIGPFQGFGGLFFHSKKMILDRTRLYTIPAEQNLSKGHFWVFFGWNQLNPGFISGEGHDELVLKIQMR